MKNEALREIQRGCAEVIDLEYIEKLVTNFYENGKTFTVKSGADPTAPDLHLGHTVVLQKLATFQKYGGNIQFLIGDFTARIGDPTGKNETRKILSTKQIIENAKSYQQQVFKILDPKKTEVFFNSTWLEKLGSYGMLTLATTCNVARMLERDDFDKRYKAQTPISISEFLYPLLQGYDSVALKSDIEVGGTDQKFNLLMGRTLQKSYNVKKQQAVLMMPILEGVNGISKMSKSLNNYIGVTDEPKDMFGKILSISDELMWRYYKLLSSLTLDEISKKKESVKCGSLHPKVAKEALAFEIVKRFYDENLAQNAQNEFKKVHVGGAIPSDILEYTLNGPIWVCKALVETKLVVSTSQARRDIAAGAFKINQIKNQDIDLKLQNGEYILQIGKRKFIKVKVIS